MDLFAGTAQVMGKGRKERQIRLSMPLRAERCGFVRVRGVTDKGSVRPSRRAGESSAVAHVARPTLATGDVERLTASCLALPLGLNDRERRCLRVMSRQLM